MKQRPFLMLWSLAVIAAVAAFVVHLALRGKTVDLGYKLGRARAEQARLREMKRVLSLEAASYETPARVEMVARTLLGMTPPPPERVITIRSFWPSPEAEAERSAAGAEAAMGRVMNKDQGASAQAKAAEPESANPAPEIPVVDDTTTVLPPPALPEEESGQPEEGGAAQ